MAPFISGTAIRWVGSPLQRLPIRQLDAAGGTSYSIPILPSMVGSTRFYMGWSRDPAHPDGTGLVATNGLRVVFSN